MSNCTNNFIKRVIGVTRTFKWTVTTNGAAVPLVAEDLTLQLVPPRGEAVSLPFDVDDNIVSFTWQGDDQHIIGCYSLILWANYGEDNQRRVDIHNFVELIPWSDRQSGEYSDLVEESIELETADFGENIMVVDNLNSTSATDALSANMGRQLNVTKQDVIQDLATIRSGAAAGAAVKEWAKNDPLITDDATQVSASKLAFNGNIFEQWVPGIASSIGLKGIAGFLKLADISQWDSAYNDRMLPTVAAVKAKLQAVLTALATIEAVIPSQASSTNKLTDKGYVDGAIATNTANFVGTFDTLAELQAVQNPTKNDYGFVIEQDAQGNEYYDRYKYTGTQWLYEYKVESTPFTTEQWAAIQSGITAALVSKLSALPTNAELNTALASKQPVINDLDTIRAGAAAGATAYQKPSGGIPKTDLASAVQTSLGKADAALSRNDMATVNGSDLTHGGNVTIVAAEGQTITIDAAPTAGSSNAVSSGGMYDALAYAGVYDVSSHNSGATFASLSALLSDANLATLIPTAARKGGMSIKFVLTSDNNSSQYVQYFLTKDEWSASEADWQKSNLEDEVSQLTAAENAMVDIYVSPNLYDKAAALVGFVTNNGTISAVEGSKVSAPIPVLPNHYYLLTGRTLRGNAYTIRCLTSNLSRIKVLAASTGNEYATNWCLPSVDGTEAVVNGEFKTPATAAFVQFSLAYNANNGSIEGVMLTDLGDTYVQDPVTPEYEPFGATYTLKDDVLPSELNNRIQLIESSVATQGEDIDELQDIEDKVISTKHYSNLFDKTNLVNGYIGDTNGNLNQSESYPNARSSSQIPVTAGHYYLLSGRSASIYAIRCLDANGNKMKVRIASTGQEYTNYQLSVNGTNVTNNGEFLVPTGAVSVQFSVTQTNGSGSLDTLMLTDLGTTYVENPQTPDYQPYGVYHTIKDSALEGTELDERVTALEGQLYPHNPLWGKSVIFTGDSICNASTDRTGGGGWAKRIGENNNMTWVNRGVSGGTITNKNAFQSPSSFTISETDWGNGADYIILEGGTNDADRIGSIAEEPYPELYGSWSETTYSTNFNNNTFCGAVEMMIKHLVTNFPTAKVGFIIAQKMGTGNTALNRKAYFDTIINICKKWGVPVLNLWDNCTMNPNIEANKTALYYDTQHPNGNGYDFIAPIVESWMRTL